MAASIIIFRNRGVFRLRLIGQYRFGLRIPDPTIVLVFQSYFWTGFKINNYT